MKLLSMTARTRLGLVFLTLACMLAVPTDGEALSVIPCTAALSRSMANVASARAIGLLSCVRRAGQGRLDPGETLTSCLETKATKKLESALDTTLVKDSRHCSPPPAFGYAGGPTANDAALDVEIDLAGDVFGADFDAAIISADTSTVGATCQLETIYEYGKLRNIAAKEFARCVKRVLSGPAENASSESLAACLTDQASDADSKMVRRAEALILRLRANCPGVDPARAFPGACSSSPDISSAGQCIAEHTRCRVCLMVNRGNDLSAACDEFDNGQVDGSCVDSRLCGNAVINPGEQCDGSDVGGADCTSQGFDGGTLSCSDSCRLDTSACYLCGDGSVDFGEECDGGNLADTTCGDFGFAQGQLGCDDQCHFDTSDCSTCGNGTVEPHEACEPGDLNGQTCEGAGFDSGQLACSQTCELDTSACNLCGDGNATGPEDCDAQDLRSQTCSTRGFQSGQLACSNQCTFDETGCAVCGDNSIGGNEQCEGTDLAGQTCESQGFGGGVLSCGGDCLLDTSGCFVCGNDRTEGDESCDNGDLAGQSCQSLGFDGGTLACNDFCGFDTSACWSCGDGSTDPGEECDTLDLAGQTCATRGFDDGTLACTDSCTFDVSSCWTCGDGNIDPGEDCDSGQIGDATCAGFGFVAGEVGCDAECRFDTSGCFEDCDPTIQLPVDFKLHPDDTMLFFGDSITTLFKERSYHYAKIVRRLLGSTYCPFNDAFPVDAVGRKGSHFDRYRRRIGKVLTVQKSDTTFTQILFQDAGKALRLSRNHFHESVRTTVEAAREADPGARIVLATTPPMEEHPRRRGNCRLYTRSCNFTVHNNILTDELASSLDVDIVPWDEDFCRMLVNGPGIDLLPLTEDGVHPEPAGYLGLAISLVKWAGAPREDLNLQALGDLHPSFTPEFAEEVADWIYDPTTYDCSELFEPCGDPDEDCLEYVPPAPAP